MVIPYFVRGTVTEGGLTVERKNRLVWLSWTVPEVYSGKQLEFGRKVRIT